MEYRELWDVQQVRSSTFKIEKANAYNQHVDWLLAEIKRLETIIRETDLVGLKEKEEELDKLVRALHSVGYGTVPRG
jgi:lipoate synthase